MKRPAGHAGHAGHIGRNRHTASLRGRGTGLGFVGAPGRCAVLLVVLASCALTAQRAHAYGGLWSSPAGNIEQSGTAVLLVDNSDGTVTAVIRIQYEGPADEFAWVIPVPGMPTVAISSSTAFQRLDAATAPQYWLEVAVEGSCLVQQDALDAATDGVTGAVPDVDGSDPDPPRLRDGAQSGALQVEERSLDPYDYARLTVDPANPDPVGVASDWLAANGYDTTRLDRDILGRYLAEGLGLLAFKLKQDRDADAIRPVMLTYKSERPSIPIMPASVAARDDMGLQVWVVGPTQAVPENYRSLVLNDALVDWLGARRFAAGTLPEGGAGPVGVGGYRPENYDAIVTAAANEADGQGFTTELAGPASPYREKLWWSLDEEQFASVSGKSYADGVDAILAARELYGSWDGWRAAVEGATSLPPDTGVDEFSREPERYRGTAEVDTGRFFELLEDEVVRPVSDTAALLRKGPYLTRLYATLSAAEATADPAFDYNFELAQVSNLHVARQVIECRAGLAVADAPWRVETPQGGVVAGEGGARWPLAAGSMPANLKIVQLSSGGSGRVVTDNSDQIAMTLFDGAGTTGIRPAAQPPHDGLVIGGTQTVAQYRPTAPASVRARQSRPVGQGCSATRPGRGPSTGAVFALCFALCAWLRSVRARRRRARPLATAAAVAVLLWGCSGLVGCGDDAADPEDVGGGTDADGAMTLDELRDPETCKECHPIHYREWSSSMHAYAALDPVFLAMNRRGQRETNGELGDFCIQCHAPMAVVDKLSRDGLNLEELPDLQRGVSCYYCHNLVAIEGDHNARLSVANDTTMRGPLADAIPSPVHGTEATELFDEGSKQSSDMCGACHDIVTPTGVRLERTYQEYLTSVYSKSATGDPMPFETCLGCHMRGRAGFAASVAGAPERVVHEHLWPGIDLALVDFPNREAMRSAVEDCQLGLSVAFFTLEVTPPDIFTFQMETSAGHNQPSGAAQDRRMWLEFLAYDEEGRLLEDVSSGHIADDAIEEVPVDDPSHDPHLLMFRDRIYDAAGDPVHMFWEAEKSPMYPDGYVSHTLPPATTTYVEGKHAVVKQYRASTPDGRLPSRVTARLRVRPIGLDVLQDLVDSGDLDPAIMAEMQTLTLGRQLEWTPADGLGTTIVAGASSAADCHSYLCMLDPSTQDCR